MRTTRMTFQEVAINPSKTGKCPGCHKVAKRTTKFFQTLSPFNTNPDGSRKTSRQILDELAPQAAAWKLEPTYHVKCEG